MRGSWVIFYACGLHLTWGFVALFSPAAPLITAMRSLVLYVPDHTLLGMLLVLVGSTAIAGVARPKGIGGLLALLPQQCLLVISALDGLTCMWLSQFADGVVRPRGFIMADQIPTVLAALLHSAAIFEHYGWGWRRGRG